MRAHLRRGMHDRGRRCPASTGCRRCSPRSACAPVSAVTSVIARGSTDELFGGDLDERGLDALPELGLAGEDRDRAVRVDADPRIEHRRVLEAARKLRRFLRLGAGVLRLRREHARREREADDERAAAREELAALHRAVRPCRVFMSPRRALDRAQDAHVRAAAAEVRVHVPPDLGRRRRGIRFEQRLRAHHHAGDAVAALRGLLFDERALHRARDSPRVPRPSTVFTLRPCERRDRREAREHRAAVDHHGARAALAQAAAELRAVQLQVVAQHVQERRRGIGVDLVRLAVDVRA